MAHWYDMFYYFLIVFQLHNLAGMALGIVVGLVIGAIPGLNPPMAIALLIPITFYTPPETSLIMLSSVYAAGIYGGSFSAILMRAPGTSASAATAIEGWEMTVRGKGMDAIRISTFASVSGGILSAVVLLLVAPPAAKIALLFQPSEYFLVALLGLCSIASVSFKSLTKGLISGFIGVFLSTIGIDIKSGFPRFTYGSGALQGGIGIIPAIIGLFAVAQALEIAREDPSKAIVLGGKKERIGWNVWPKFSVIMKLKWSLVRGWIIGLIVGTIPAAGASIASWIAYGDEVRRSKPGDQFGKGEPKGVAACEAANNSTTGTSMIPMFILGIPGGISAAVILGALMIHGLNPGLQLFTETPQVVYPIIWGFLVANFLMGFFAIPLARNMVYLTYFPRGLLSPLILICAVTGVYTASSNMYDVWIMAFFGILGYFMNKHDFVPAGTLLGLILGPICENGFRDWLIISHGHPMIFMLKRPVSDILLILIALTILFSLKNTKRVMRNRSLGQKQMEVNKAGSKSG